MRRVRLVVESRQTGARASRRLGWAPVVAGRLVMLLEPLLGFDIIVVFAQGNKAVVALQRAVYLNLLILILILVVGDVLGAIGTKPIPCGNRVQGGFEAV